MTLSPGIMLVLCVALGSVLLYVIKCIQTSCGSINHCPLLKKVGSPLCLDIFKVAMVFDLTLVLISFSAFFSPSFFDGMNYKVNTTDYDITAFQATDLFVNAMVAVVIGYVFIEIERG